MCQLYSSQSNYLIKPAAQGLLQDQRTGDETSSISSTLVVFHHLELDVGVVKRSHISEHSFHKNISSDDIT